MTTREALKRLTTDVKRYCGDDMAELSEAIGIAESALSHAEEEPGPTQEKWDILAKRQNVLLDEITGLMKLQASHAEKEPVLLDVLKKIHTIAVRLGRQEPDSYKDSLAFYEIENLAGDIIKEAKSGKRNELVRRFNGPEGDAVADSLSRPLEQSKEEPELRGHDAELQWCRAGFIRGATLAGKSLKWAERKAKDRYPDPPLAQSSEAEAKCECVQEAGARITAPDCPVHGIGTAYAQSAHADIEAKP